jgi:hypothetical protein
MQDSRFSERNPGNKSQAKILVLITDANED